MKRIVSMADMIISQDPADVLVTYALGSCLGISVYDPDAGVGGLLHVMLPESKIDPQKAILNPFMFVDTALPLLFTESYKLGAKKERMIVKVAGGAHPQKNAKEDYFQIGKRNILMLRKLMWKNGVLAARMDVEGKDSRTMTLAISDGKVTIKKNGQTSIL